jgi:hypothetical protein
LYPCSSIFLNLLLPDFLDVDIDPLPDIPSLLSVPVVLVSVLRDMRNASFPDFSDSFTAFCGSFFSFFTELIDVELTPSVVDGFELQRVGVLKSFLFRK